MTGERASGEARARHCCETFKESVRWPFTWSRTFAMKFPSRGRMKKRASSDAGSMELHWLSGKRAESYLIAAYSMGPASIRPATCGAPF